MTLSLPYFTKVKWRNKELNHLLKVNQLKVWRKDGMVQVSLHIIPANSYSQTQAGHSGSCRDCNPEIQPVPNIFSLAYAQISDSFSKLFILSGSSYLKMAYESHQHVVSLIYQCLVSYCAEQGHDI